MIGALCIGLALLGQPGEHPPSGARSVELDQAFPFWTDYLALPADERSAFRLDYMITERSGRTASFWVETEDGFAPLMRDDAGAATPPRVAAFEDRRRLFTDAPEGGVAVSMRLSLSTEPSQEYQIAALEAALAQSANAMRSLMGLRALFMPRLDTVRFSFDGPAPDAVIVYEDGREAAIETVYGDVITVHVRDRIMRGARAVRFGEEPESAVLETGR